MEMTRNVSIKMEFGSEQMRTRALDIMYQVVSKKIAI